MKKTLTILFSTASLILPVVALAGGPAIPTPNPQGGEGAIATTLSNVAWAIMLIISAAAVVLVVAAGFQFLTAGGDPEKVSAARDKVVYAVIGVIVGALAWSIIKIIVTAIV